MPEKLKNARLFKKQKRRNNQKHPVKHEPRPNRQRWFVMIGLPLVFCGFLWSYGPTITNLLKIWMRSDEYSSGLLVPVLAVYIAWSRREQIAQCQIRPSMWGALLFLAAQGIRFLGLFLMYSSAERLSLVLSIAALVLLLFGGRLLGKVTTILLFLCLMLPLPRMLETRITLPLQTWATSSAVFCLEIIGYDVIQEGNIIHIGSTSVAVAEACNGLRMVTAFIVITGLVALLVRRAWWEKLILLMSALPVGLLCNTIRLAVTAMAFTVLAEETWGKLFHDFGGYAMMPLALALVVCELWVLKKMTACPKEQEPPEKDGILISPSGYDFNVHMRKEVENRG